MREVVGIDEEDGTEILTLSVPEADLRINI
jgi:hypothetical protein